MVKAYVLIEMQAGRSRNLVESLNARGVAVAVDRVTGPYDLVVVLQADDIDEVSDIVEAEIHSLPGVVRTITCVSLD